MRPQKKKKIQQFQKNQRNQKGSGSEMKSKKALSLSPPQFCAELPAVFLLQPSQAVC